VLHDVIHLDDEAPMVVDKRSFDEDYKLDPISSASPSGHFTSSAFGSAGAGAGVPAPTSDGPAHDVFGTLGTPMRPSEVEVIPPTPTTVASRDTVMTTRTQNQNQNQNQNQGQTGVNAMGRRPSHATQGSIGSAGSTPTRVLAKGKAMGLDGEWGYENFLPTSDPRCVSLSLLRKSLSHADTPALVPFPIFHVVPPFGRRMYPLLCS
jgi:hypothetical protein